MRLSSIFFQRSILSDLKQRFDFACWEECHLPDEGDVHSHGAMLGGALVAEEDADVGRAPLGVLAPAVEALLRGR